jgi:hypothetical protein
MDFRRPGGEPDCAPSSKTPGGYVGQAAFDRWQIPRMIAPKKIWHYPTQVAGGSRERLRA